VNKKRAIRPDRTSGKRELLRDISNQVYHSKDSRIVHRAWWILWRGISRVHAKEIKHRTNMNHNEQRAFDRFMVCKEKMARRAGMYARSRGKRFLEIGILLFHGNG
jgi:hypothetical protein